MTQEELARWLYDEFDPNYDMEPDSCDAQYGPHCPWDQMSPNEQKHWRRKAGELMGKLGVIGG